MANETGTGHRGTAAHLGLVECRVWESLLEERSAGLGSTGQWPLPVEGDRPVRRLTFLADFFPRVGLLGSAAQSAR